MLIDKLAWIYIKEGKILSTRSFGKTKYYIPGGKREKFETDRQALKREIKEELNVDLAEDTLTYYGTFTAQADSCETGVLVQMTCYRADLHGNIQAKSEIEDVVWLNFVDLDKISEVDILIFEQLKKDGILT